MPGRWLNRRREQDPFELLRRIDLRKGMYFADLGCGDGYFTIPGAVIVGETGKAFGVDSNPDRIQALREDVRRRRITNLVTSLGQAEDTVFCQRCMDIAFLGNVLHDFNDPVAVLKNARTMLKTGAKLVNLDWRRTTRQDFGPPHERRFSEEKAASLLEKAGFAVDNVAREGKFHYLVTAKPVKAQ